MHGNCNYPTKITTMSQHVYQNKFGRCIFGANVAIPAIVWKFIELIGSFLEYKLTYKTYMHNYYGYVLNTFLVGTESAKNLMLFLPLGSHRSRHLKKYMCNVFNAGLILRNLFNGL